MQKQKKRQVAFEELAWQDYQFWVDQDVKLLKRINKLIEESLRDPFKGIGKPEPLKGELQGCWSRRINEEHRLVYLADDERIIILQCRYHYKK